MRTVAFRAPPNQLNKGFDSLCHRQVWRPTQRTRARGLCRAALPSVLLRPCSGAPCPWGSMQATIDDGSTRARSVPIGKAIPSSCAAAAAAAAPRWGHFGWARFHRFPGIFAAPSVWWGQTWAELWACGPASAVPPFPTQPKCSFYYSSFAQSGPASSQYAGSLAPFCDLAQPLV
jgi:hypothetical protein